MAEHDKHSKTEKPTPRRLRKARRDGKVARSQEVGTALVFTGVLALIALYGAEAEHRIQVTLAGYLSNCGQYQLAPSSLGGFLETGMIRTASLAGPFVLTCAGLAFFASIAQGGWIFSTKKMKIDFNKLNPMKNVGRIWFSRRTLVRLVRNLLLLSVLSWIAWDLARDSLPIIAAPAALSAEGVAESSRWLVVKFGARVCLLILPIAVLDYLFQRKEHERSLKMTRREVKDDFKETEGDPLVRSRLRRAQREMVQRRMLANVDEADVVIVNPTRIAVALRYRSEESSAPIVLAKGKGWVAERIRTRARNSGVPIVANPPLAQLLYRTAKVGKSIPEALFRTVAKILAEVYRNRPREAVL